MYSVIKVEKKIFNSEVLSIPDLWTRGSIASKCFLCPELLTQKIFLAAVRKQFTPLPTWQKVKCQILESKFKTYELAKAAEVSIVSNLERTKRNGGTAQRVRHIDTTPAVSPETNNLDEIILEKVEAALAHHLNFSTTRPNIEFNTMILEKIEEAVCRQLKGFNGSVPDMTNQGNQQSNTIIFAANDGVGACGGSTVSDGDGACGGFSDMGERVDVLSPVLPVKRHVFTDNNDKANEGSKQSNINIVAVGDEGCGGCAVSNGDVACGNLADIAERTVTKERFDKLVPIKPDAFAKKNLAKLETLVDNLNELKEEHNKNGFKNLTTTMRFVTDKIIDNDVLIHYSYMGAGKQDQRKDAFKDFPNIVNFIVQTTMEAYNYYNAGRDGFQKKTEEEVFKHFKDSFLKYAKQRSGTK